MIEGLHRPDAGAISVLGLDVRKQAPAIKNRVGVQLQTAALYPQLDGHRAAPPVRELLRPDAAGRRGPRTTSSSARSATRRRRRSPAASSSACRSRSRSSTTPRWSSSTSRRRASTRPPARASGRSIRRMQGEGRTILMTTHYMEEAEALCDRLAIMDHGKILDTGTVEELIGRRFKERSVRFGQGRRAARGRARGAGRGVARRRGGRRDRRCSRATSPRTDRRACSSSRADRARSPRT